MRFLGGIIFIACALVTGCGGGGPSVGEPVQSALQDDDNDHGEDDACKVCGRQTINLVSAPPCLREGTQVNGPYIIGLNCPLPNGSLCPLDPANCPPTASRPAIVTHTEKWALPLPGASYVSSCPTCGSDINTCPGGGSASPTPPTQITFVQQFKLPRRFANPSFSMTTTNDDAANVYLNGHLLGCADTFGLRPGEKPITLGTVEPSFFKAGSNEIRYELANANAPCPISMAYTVTITYDECHHEDHHGHRRGM